MYLFVLIVSFCLDQPKPENPFDPMKEMTDAKEAFLRVSHAAHTSLWGDPDLEEKLRKSIDLPNSERKAIELELKAQQDRSESLHKKRVESMRTMQKAAFSFAIRDKAKYSAHMDRLKALTLRENQLDLQRRKLRDSEESAEKEQVLKELTALRLAIDKEIAVNCRLFPPLN